MGGKSKTYHYICHILPAVIFLVLFFLPIGKESIYFYSSQTPRLLWTFKLPFDPLFSNSIAKYFFFVLYALPLEAIFLIITLFIKKNLSKPIYITVFSVLTIYLICSLSVFLITANSVSWFKELPVYIYLFYAIEIFAHIVLCIYGFINLKKQNPQYTEYKKIQEIEKKNLNQTHSIKVKLNVTIISTITVILMAFMILILQRYKGLITEAVSDMGRSKAEQTSAVYDSAEGKYEKIANFFETQKTANAYADTPFERIDIIITNSSAPIYLEEITPASELPAYDVFAYTTGKPSAISEGEKSITPEKAHEYVRRYQNGTYRRQPVYDKTSKTCKYIYPVSFARKKGSRLLGFSIVTYKQELLMEPYFKTKIFVIAMALSFLYLSVIISFILSDLIVNPLLYLKTNVRKASNSISDLLSGTAKIETQTLVFEDTIKTKDEVKNLSTEIGNLVSLIRGIVPYISFSTLKNAEKTDSKKSTARELCFLFTDIRGFTTLCEGMQPKEVVGILNHYLDIETEIILNNGGDVDKFVGDEMMAFFAGPKKEYNACKAAMEIRTAMRAEQQKSKETGKNFISIGIGINSGKVVFGPVGSKTRMDFTSIGDTVNLASRLEGANKAYGSKSIITEAVYSKLHNSFICRELDFITVKGKTEPVRIYEILQSSKTSAEKIHEIKALFEKGLAYYRLQKWDQAEKAFSECAQKYNDYPSIVFIDRIHHFKENPPPKGWDGVFNMKVK